MVGLQIAANIFDLGTRSPNPGVIAFTMSLLEESQFDFKTFKLSKQPGSLVPLKPRPMPPQNGRKVSRFLAGNSREEFSLLISREPDQGILNRQPLGLQ